MTDVIEQGGEWDCTSAEEFLDKLSLRKPQWRPWPGAWLFRGQPGDWPLLPKAYRDNGGKFREIGITCRVRPRETKPTPSAYRTALNQLKTQFSLGLDGAGLSIPSPSPRLFDQVATEPDKLPAQATPLLALAQHVGLPTPLLDWTTRPLVAAYFALPAIPSDATQLVVWALRGDMVLMDVELAEIAFDFKKALLTVESAPRASNPNLHAQSGRFTLIEGTMASEYSLEAYVEAVAAALTSHVITSVDIERPFMRKLTLPGTQAKNLQRFLYEEGITGSSMFPGADGVVKAMKERAIWSMA